MMTREEWDADARARRWRWSLQGGVYVVRFPDRVKVGKSCVMFDRIQQHRANGATRAVGLQAWDPRTTERAAIDAMSRRAERIRRTESFRGITFVEAESLLARVVRDIDGEWPETILVWSQT